MSVEANLVIRLWINKYYQLLMGPNNIEQAVAEEGRCLLEGFFRLHKTWLHEVPPTRYEHGSD